MVTRTRNKDEVGYTRPADSRHEQIIKAAGALFVSKGYLKTTVREIARASGITVGTLYHYFSSKDDILSFIQEDTSDFISNLVQEAEETLSQSGPVEALRLAIRKYFSIVNDFQDITLFWYHDTGNLQPAHQEHLLHCDELLGEAFKRILDAGCQSGEFKQHDTTLTAHDIIVLGDMWAFRRWFLRKHYTFAQYATEQIDLILSAITNNRFQRQVLERRAEKTR
ncbi:MAG: TetR/AcrR family transcriptional regulator [Dehalococcoidia bacterium]|nr:TetR/AcrR family transcriptional regulator [Dehalococcoidia bacterium]